MIFEKTKRQVIEVAGIEVEITQRVVDAENRYRINFSVHGNMYFLRRFGNEQHLYFPEEEVEAAVLAEIQRITQQMEAEIAMLKSFQWGNV